MGVCRSSADALFHPADRSADERYLRGLKLPLSCTDASHTTHDKHLTVGPPARYDLP